ncbi:two-component regulator propeller domain-containing protein [Ferruginibacter profundus]
MALLLCVNSIAQSPYSKKIDVEEENLILKTTTLLKDHNGFLWIGTSEGLFKYNSLIPEKIVIAGQERAYISALYEDADGTIWAGCKNGQVITIRNHSIDLFKPADGLPKVTITNICTDAAKRLWFATAGEGIYCYDNNRLYKITTADGLGDDNVNCLYTAEGKRIIAGTDRGLSFINFDNGKKYIHFFSSKNGLPDNIVRCIVAAQQKNMVWIGMQSRGIVLFNIQTEQIVTAGNTLQWKFGQVNDISELKNETLIATEQSGIICYNKINNAFTDKFLRDTIFPKRIADLQTDNESNIWAASENKIVSFTGDYLRYWFAAKNTSFIKVHALLADDEKKLWFTPDFGLYESTIENLGKENLHSYEITPPKEHIDITSLYKDKFGFIWIGTMGEGLFRLNTITGKWRRIDEDPIAYYGNILSIAGKDNQVWVSTLNGVARFTLTENNYDLAEKISYTNYNKNDGLGSDYIYHILIDSKNRVWFATDGAGVALFYNNLFINFYLEKMFPSKVTYSLAEDKNHHIWISTYNDGLFEYDEKKFIQYGIKNGLTDMAITSIAADEYNNIIAVNKKGIDVFNPVKNIVQHYGSESGFEELQPNLNSIAKDADGNIWIGTDKGIVRFVSQQSFSSYTPQAIIEQVTLFNNPVNTDLENSFEHDQNNFSFKFAAAYYKAPEKIRFQYFLDGYSKKWETTGDRMINFPQLRPGKYTLKIRASASDNFEASPVANYVFTIANSFYTTWWFRLVAALAIAGLLYFFVKQRIRGIRKKEYAERERFQLQYDALKNQVNPHFLFNSFNALMNIVEENPGEASMLIKHLSQFYRKMTAYSQKELITVGEELELLQSYLYIQEKRYGDALQISISVEPVLKKSTFIPPLVLQLLAENAVKHNAISKFRPLHIHIFSEGDTIVIQNNINSKMEPAESEGVGLQNIKNRYKVLTNREVVQEENGEIFTVRLPLLNSN